MAEWSQVQGLEFIYIRPGKPTQNAFIERFNGTFRWHVLDACLFENLEEVIDISAAWVEDYNYNRPHDALGGLAGSRIRPEKTSLAISNILNKFYTFNQFLYDEAGR